jgi:hypothetical protein
MLFSKATFKMKSLPILDRDLLVVEGIPLKLGFSSKGGS